MSVILMVQEIEANVEEIEIALAPLGHELLLAWSVPEAILLVAEHQIDMVICAVHLETGSVFDLLKHIKSSTILRPIKFVFFCQDPDEIALFVNNSVKATAMILGADKYMVAIHLDPEELRTEIESLLESTDHTPYDDKQLLCFELKRRAKQATDAKRFGEAERLLRSILSLMKGSGDSYPSSDIAEVNYELANLLSAAGKPEEARQASAEIEDF